MKEWNVGNLPVAYHYIILFSQFMSLCALWLILKNNSLRPRRSRR